MHYVIGKNANVSKNKANVEKPDVRCKFTIGICAMQVYNRQMFDVS